VNEAYNVGEWEIVTHESGEVTASHPRIGKLKFDKSDHAALNDLIGGLMVANPGDNPEFVAPSVFAQHQAITNRAAKSRFIKGHVPGGVKVKMTMGDGEIRFWWAMPEIGLQFASRKKRPRGNPALVRLRDAGNKEIEWSDS
jgi:hypothetical protein